MAIKKEHPNIKILETAVHQLGPLVGEMVFLGGCATFIDALPGHLLPDKASQSRSPIILSRIESISKLQGNG